jgi:pteridine reductase
MGEPLHDKVVLITGGARRVGAVIARKLHAAGAHVVIHYHHSARHRQRPWAATCST